MKNSMRMLIMATLLGILLPELGAPVAAGEWGAPMQVSLQGREAMSPVMIPLGSQAFCLIWVEYDGARHRVVCRGWSQGAWSSQRSVSNGERNALYPCAAISQGKIYASWIETDGSQNGSILFSRSLDSGISWSDPATIASSQLKPGGVDIAANGANIHLAWNVMNVDGGRILYAASGNSGDAWGVLKTVRQSLADCHHARLALTSSQAHVIWEDWRNIAPEIYCRSTANQGASWAPEYPLSSIDAFPSEHPDIVGSGSALNLVWQEEAENGSVIMHSRSPNEGGSWMRKRLTAPSLNATAPILGLHGARLMSVFNVEAEGVREVQALGSGDTGVSWSGPFSITPGDGVWSGLPHVGLSTEADFAAWTDLGSSGAAVLFSRSPAWNQPASGMWLFR